MGYSVAEKPLELYSPYRIYMHRVLAQRCGTPEAISIVLCSLLQRAAAAGLLTRFDVQVGIPAPGNRAVLRQKDTHDHADADVKYVPPSHTTFHNAIALIGILYQTPDSINMKLKSY